MNSLPIVYEAVFVSSAYYLLKINCLRKHRHLSQGKKTQRQKGICVSNEMRLSLLGTTNYTYGKKLLFYFVFWQGCTTHIISCIRNILNKGVKSFFVVVRYKKSIYLYHGGCHLIQKTFAELRCIFSTVPSHRVRRAFYIFLKRAEIKHKHLINHKTSILITFTTKTNTHSDTKHKSLNPIEFHHESRDTKWIFFLLHFI